MSFFEELKRRHVLRTAGVYILGAWLLIQVADIVGEAFGLTDAGMRLVIIGHDANALRLYDRIENMPIEPDQVLGNLFNEGRLPFGHVPAVNAANLYLKTGQIDRRQRAGRTDGNAEGDRGRLGTPMVNVAGSEPCCTGRKP